MKSMYIAFFLLMASVVGFAQENSIENVQEIDPRQYVKVYFKKRPKDEAEFVWTWSNNQNNKIHALQVKEVIDLNGEITIQFDRHGLSNNKDFIGTISLEAEITGEKGLRRIEVSPYSEVGLERKEIGVKTNSPSEISENLINLIRNLSDINRLNRTVDPKGSNDVIETYKSGIVARDIDFLTDRLETLKKQLITKKLKPDSVTFSIEDHNELRDVISRLEKNTFFPLFGTLQRYSVLTHSEVILELNKIRQNIKLNNVDKSQRELEITNRYKELIDKMELTIKYINAFEQAGEDAFNGFLSLLSKDRVEFDFLKTRLELNYESLKKIFSVDDKEIISKVENQNLYSNSVDLLKKISETRGSAIEIIFNDENNAILKERSNNNYSSEADKDSYIRNLINEVIIKKYDQLKSTISIKAAEIIYKKLVYATIGLGKAGAKEGEVLNLYLRWIGTSKDNDSGRPPRLDLGTYILRKTGWYSEISDSFLLIQRINEPDPSTSNSSPSNFKGAPGVSLMRTFYYQENAPRLLNKIQPSIGLNVSYVDFSTAKDVEIGTGLTIGLFANKVFLGYGINLHQISAGEKSPTYFSLGFSFANIADKFRSRKTSDESK